MSLLKNLKTDNTIGGETDSLGGATILDSGLYTLTIEKAYLLPSAGGAAGLHLHTVTENGTPFRTTLWITSGTAKGSLPYYVDKNGDKKYLPGFLMANSIVQLITGKELADLDTEVKVISAWSADASAEVPTKVEMLMDLLGKEIYAGVIRQKVDKRKKNDATGEYESTGETREENELDKAFHAESHMTVTEIKANAETATFCDQWAKKNAGKIKDKTGGAKATGTAPGKPAATASKPATKSLFG